MLVLAMNIIMLSIFVCPKQIESIVSVLNISHITCKPLLQCNITQSEPSISSQKIKR